MIIVKNVSGGCVDGILDGGSRSGKKWIAQQRLLGQGVSGMSVVRNWDMTVSAFPSKKIDSR